ncbi:GGDEF domain-containing protein [Alteromonas flava]|uniref:GGDEF domain-containing protein n=1 Tax=Alteromonas flava TaxID=2048003 RepID=UPI000C287486|nr:GGDEF domain-containing protein [Alteromonas flava]
MQDNVAEPIPNFVVNSTRNIALVSCVILFPFMVVDLIQGEYLLAAGIAGLITLYLATAYRCHHDNYSLNMSLFGIAPVITGLSVFSLYKLGISASFWSFAALFVLYFVLPVRLAAWVNGAFLIVITPFAYNIMQFNEFSRFMLVLVGTSGFVFMCMREIYNQNRLLVTLSYTDTLTGLHNRATLNDSVLQAISIEQRYQTPVTMLIIDVDHFKAINDQFGHNAGDDTLKSIAHLMQENFRAPDKLFRIGGEEFLVLLHDTDAESARTIAERFRLAVADSEMLAAQSVTVSIGVCQKASNMSAQEWVSACDKLLYKAKTGGRNKTVCS